MDPVVLAELRGSGVYRYKTIEQGAATSVLAATSAQLEGVGGRYVENCNEAEMVHVDPAEPPSSGVADYALDTANAERLWELSESLIGPT
jgi:hypothetical protein